MIIQHNMLYRKDSYDCSSNLNCTVKIWGKLQISKGKFIQGVKNLKIKNCHLIKTF